MESYLRQPPATEALGRAIYGYPGKIGTKKYRAWVKKKALIPLAPLMENMTEITTIESSFTKYLAWFRAHERLVLVVVLVVFGAFLANKAYDYLLKHDQVQAQIAHDQAVQSANTANNSQKVSDQSSRNPESVASTDSRNQSAHRPTDAAACDRNADTEESR